MLARVRIPPLILVLFAIDLAIGLAYVLNYLAGRPYRPLSLLLDLNGECNLPSWYSSVQWFGVAALLGLFAHRNFDRSSPRSWLLIVMALVFLGFSFDEVVQIHEAVGKRTDALLPGGTRQDTVFSRTGIWMFVLGIPFVAFFVWLTLSMRIYFQRAPGALVKLLAGTGIFLAAATGIEALSNFVTPGSGYDALENFLEEGLEMVGSTIVLWGSYEVLCKDGFSFGLDRADLTASAPPPGARPSLGAARAPVSSAGFPREN